MITRTFFLLIFFMATPAFAFYQFESATVSFEARGFLRLWGWGSDNPNNEFLYENKNDAGVAGLARLLVDAKLGDNVKFELNGYEFFSSSTSSFFFSPDSARDVERSSALEWSHKNEKKRKAAFAIDRVNASFSYDRIDITVGRQAVNLATSYYFTPNDFFAPFTASTFYRVYKPGVDALRVEFRVGALTQFTLLGVAGYENDTDELSGWSDEVAVNRNSGVARITTVISDYEFGLLGGSVRGDDVLGGSFQGEFYQTGLRVEGHFRERDDENGGGVSEISVELDRRFEDSLNLRLSFFHHGAGANDTDDYLQSEGPYLAKRYIAGGAGYEFTPLFYGEALLLLNVVDSSHLASLYFVYSLSDESELSLLASIPFGDEPEERLIKSEYGTYPATLNFEFRAYF